MYNRYSNIENRLNQIWTILDSELPELKGVNQKIDFLKTESEKTNLLLFLILTLYYPNREQLSIFHAKLKINSIEAIIQEYYYSGDVLFKTTNNQILFDVTETSTAVYNTGIQRVTRKIYGAINQKVTGYRWNNRLQPIEISNPLKENLINWSPGANKIPKEEVNYIKIQDYYLQKNLLTNLVFYLNMKRKSSNKFYDIQERPKYQFALKTLATTFPAKVVERNEVIFLWDSTILITELFHLNSNISQIYQNLSRLKFIKLNVLVHDVIPFSEPEFVGGGTISGYVHYFHILNGCNLILVPTQFISEQLTKQMIGFGFVIPRIEVVPLSGDFINIDRLKESNQNHDDARNIVMLGSLDPRKNQTNMMAALLIVQRRMKIRVVLNIIAGGEWLSSEIRNMVKLLSADGIKVNLRISVTDLEISEIFKDSEFLMFCSYSEGFGLPIAEASKFGLPVVTTEKSSMEEVARLFSNKYLLTNSRSLADISNKLEMAFMGKWEIGAPTHASRTWEEVAREVLKLLREDTDF
jgi:glycosyltransferase involved in cell wall biosynthesis